MNHEAHRGIGLLLKEAARGWLEHRAQRLGASLAFYTTLALAPLTIIAIAVAGYFFGEDAARGGIVDQIENLVGREGATAIESLIEKASEPHQTRIATVISIGLLLFGATGVFVELKDSLDTIWEVKRKPGLGLWMIAKTQLLAFAIVVGTGFLLLVSCGFEKRSSPAYGLFIPDTRPMDLPLDFWPLEPVSPRDLFAGPQITWPSGFKSRTMTGAVPRVFRAVPVNAAAQVRTDC